MKANDRDIWFPAKKYGWGWGWPCAWQGWVVYALFVVLLCAGAVLLLSTGHLGLYVAWAIMLGVALFIAALVKGEKPRWRWGESEPQPARSATDRLAELDELRRRQLISEAEYEAKRQEILRGL